MKLCGLTQSYAPTGGGIRTFLHAQRDWCHRHGVEHTLIVPDAADGVAHDGLLHTYTIASPFVPGSRVYRLLLRSGRVLEVLRAVLPDIIEVHDAYNLPWTALLHRRRHGGLVSGMYMTDLPVAYVQAPLQARVGTRVAAAARLLTERYLRALYNRCDFAVAISPAMRDRLRDIGVRAPHYVSLGVDTLTFSPARRDGGVRARLGAAPDDLLLIYAGRLDAERRPDFLVDALARVPAPDVHLVLAGDGPQHAQLAGLAERTPRLHVMPFVQDRLELARLLASADVYVSAMAHETFGLAVVEAQACGLPVVGVRAGAMLDRVHDGEGFLIDPGSPAEMAERIVHTPRAEWRRMGRRARDRVEAELSWDRTFATLLEIYRSRR